MSNLEKQNQNQNQVISGGNNLAETFKIANALAQSTIIPIQYQKNPANCFVALEIASRMNASPFMVMQNLHIIQGRPSWSSSFIISAINTSGRFKTPLQFELKGKVEDLSLECYAYATLKDGTLCKGPTVSLKMAKSEGWIDKNGSKWKTMPELMIRYRAAAFFGRLYTPEILMGMHTVEEIIDIDPTDISTVSPEEEIKINANTGEIMDFEEESTTSEPVKETKQTPKVEPEPVKVEKEQPKIKQENLFAGTKGPRPF